VDAADDVGGPDADHEDQHSAGEVRGFTAAETGGPAKEDEEDVESPHDEGCENLGIEEVGGPERGFLHEHGTKDEADGHAGETKKQHGVGNPLEGIERRKPVGGRAADVFKVLELGLEAVFKHQVKERRQEAES